MKLLFCLVVLAASASVAHAEIGATSKATIDTAVRAAIAAASHQKPEELLGTTPLCQLGTNAQNTIEQVNTALEALGLKDLDLSPLPISEEMISFFACQMTVDELIHIAENMTEK